MKTALIITLSSPLLFGIYENGELIQELKPPLPSSDALIELLSSACGEHKITKIIYTNGPGSFMGLKLSYVALSIFCEVRGIELFAVSGFEFSRAISARKGFCFVKENDEIVIKEARSDELKLPSSLKGLKLSDDLLPNYILDAV